MLQHLTLVMLNKVVLESHADGEVPHTIVAYSEEQLLEKLPLLDI